MCIQALWLWLCPCVCGCVHVYPGFDLVGQFQPSVSEAVEYC